MSNIKIFRKTNLFTCFLFSSTWKMDVDKNPDFAVPSTSTNGQLETVVIDFPKQFFEQFDPRKVENPSNRPEG